MKSSLECFKIFNFILKESALIYSIWIYISFVHGLENNNYDKEYCAKQFSEIISKES